jgi:type IV secretory pathway TrbF-like protein
MAAAHPKARISNNPAEAEGSRHVHRTILGVRAIVTPWKNPRGGDTLSRGPAALGQSHGRVVALALRPAAVPFVIEASETGEARLLGPAQSAYEPSDAQLSWHLARFVEMIRGLPSDPIVVRQNWLRAYDWATQAGGQVLNTMAEEEAPFAKIGKSTVAVEVLSVVRASPDSFQLRWRESTYANGALIDVERFTGVATIVIDPASTPERLSKNPLGLYVHGFNWSRDLHQ